MNINQDINVAVLRMKKREIINYTYILTDMRNRRAMIIDPSWESDKIKNYLRSNDLVLEGVLLTHYHYDHVNLVPWLIEQYDCTIYIGLEEINYYNYMCRNMEPLFDWGVIPFSGNDIQCIETPGHTRGSMCFLINNNLFTGDTLFMEGCGACDMKGGDAKSMFDSLQKIKRFVNEDTIIYPGHAFNFDIGLPYPMVYDNNIYLQLQDETRFIEFRMRKSQKQSKFR